MPDGATQIAKTGKSLDTQKRHLIHPLVAARIRKVFGKARILSIADLGCGDGSSFLDLVSQLAGGHTENSPAMEIRSLGFLDNDKTIVPALEGNIHRAKLPSDKVRVELALANGHYDLAMAQLVLHQIQDLAELRAFVSDAHRALKAEGRLFVVNLHPLYLDYHTRYSGGKLVMTRNEDDYIGEYRFDSNTGLGIPIVGRTIAKYIHLLKDCGFATLEIVPIFSQAIAASKPRYLDMWNRRIPMFYLMDLVRM